jgi:hypothetical protein
MIIRYIATDGYYNEVCLKLVCDARVHKSAFDTLIFGIEIDIFLYFIC